MANTTRKSPQHFWRAAAMAAALGLGGFAQGATFVPSSGRLLVVGQDTDSIAAYVAALGAAETPGGVTAYIDMNLGGLSTLADNGAGANNVATLAAAYPNSALAIGVYAVNQLGAINSGSLDANIDTMINTLKNHNRPVYLRFGYEFDGPWNAYDPAAFKSAWIRVYNRIVALGAQNNIAMVWQSSTWCNTGGTVERFGGYTLDSWYPGDQYVDMVAVSYFTPSAASALKGGTCTTGNEAIDAVASFASSHSKPLMIAEATPQGYHIANLTWRDTNGNNTTPPAAVTAAQIQTWYTDFFNWITSKNVKVVAYINANWDSQPMWDIDVPTGTYPAGYWGDSRVQANTTIKNDWLSKVSSTNGYLKASSSLFSSLGYGSSSSDTTAPGTPGTVSVGSATATALSVSWGAATDNVGVTGYEVFRGSTSLGTVTGLSYTDSGLTASTTYSYQVRARDAAGNWSAKTSAVSGTTTAASSGGSSGAAFGIDSAGKLYHAQGTQTGTWHYLCLNSVCQSGSLVSGRYERAVSVTAGTSYTIEFKVQDNTTGQCLSGVSTVTYASGGVTATSACASGSSGGSTSTDTTAPSVPGGVAVGSATASSLAVSWTASTDAVGVTAYEVFRGSTSLGTTTSLSFTDSNLSASTSYSYQVRARDAAGNWSAKSSTVTGSTTAASSGGSSGNFGIDSAGKFYHVKGSQTGSWQYLCLDSDCRAGTLVGTRYERAVSVTVGTSYSIEFKVQDDSTGQCLSGAKTVTYASAGVTASSACAP